MPIMDPDRLDRRLTQLWYKTDDELHKPVIAWLDQAGARPHVEKFCNKVLAQSCTEALRRAVPTRSMVVKININLRKAAQVFFSNVPPQAQATISPQMVAIAIEMLFEDAGYNVEDGTLTHSVHVPPLQEAIAADEALPTPALAADPEDVLDEDDDEGDDDIDTPDKDVEALLSDDDGEPAEEMSTPLPPAPPAELQFEETPVTIGSIYSNGKGIHRRVDSVDDGKVNYTVVQGKGRVKAGQTGSSSYKSFINWAKEAVAA